MNHDSVTAPHEIVRVWGQRQDVRPVHDRIDGWADGVESDRRRAFVV